MSGMEIVATGYAQEGREPTLLQRVNGHLKNTLFLDVAGGKLTIPKVSRDGVPVLEPSLDPGGQPLTDSQGAPILSQAQRTVEFPLVVTVLFLGAIFFSLVYRFISFRGFWHSISVIAGRYDRPEDAGEISHFRALTSALSATVGLGNIAGVAVAIQTGGPGAVFWMIVTAFFGMASKFSSCTLSQLYRQVNPDGSISGGPMYYIDIGFRKKGKGFAVIGKCLAVMYALMVMGGAVGGGNMFQANQTVEAFEAAFGISKSYDWLIGVVMAISVGVVILGGIKRIGLATSRIVPIMCGIYVLAALFVIGANIDRLGESFALIVRLAFSENAFFGGIWGVMVTGVTRAAFSNEAGLGSAAIAHAAAKTDEPVREGIVAMIGPFIDTMIICLMTALVVIITGTWDNPELVKQGSNIGVTITSEAFRTVLPWFPYLLTVSICLFAYSTMVSWCYYGERGWIYLLDHFNGAGLKTVVVFRVLFIVSIVIGATNPLEDVIGFTDMMILSMALPNIVGSVILTPSVLPLVNDYWSRYTSGAMQPVK